jgi:hypothetical protein
MNNDPDSERMSVRILDKDGAEIVSFFSAKSEEDKGGFSADLRDALLAFLKKYPATRFIDVEFPESSWCPEATKASAAPPM